MAAPPSAAAAPPARPFARAAALRGAALLALWLVIAGTAPAGLPFGLAAAALATWASLRLMPPAPLRLRPGALALLVLRFPWQALRAGTQVALLALDPRRPLRPGTVVWTPRLPPEDRGRDLFLAYASLLPGTLPAGEVEGGAIAVHALDTAAPVAADMTAEEARFAHALGRDA